MKQPSTSMICTFTRWGFTKRNVRNFAVRTIAAPDSVVSHLPKSRTAYPLMSRILSNWTAI